MITDENWSLIVATARKHGVPLDEARAIVFVYAPAPGTVAYARERLAREWRETVAQFKRIMGRT